MGAFREYARAAMAAGGKRGRTPVMNAQRFYPRGLERELEQKTVAEFARIYRAFLEAAVAGFSTFGDDQLDLAGESPILSEKFKGEVMDVARRTDRKARDNFSRQSEMIIGAPYYPPGTAEGILDDWHATFQDLCVSACAQQKTKMAVIVAGAKQAGWNKAQLEKAIERELPAQFRHRAELIARTELGKLNSRVAIETYKSTGVLYYKWLTTIDGRERDSHAAMNGRICSVSDGDVYFDQNPENPLRPVEHARTGDMYHGHPGTDFQCRCSMVMWDPEIDGDYEVKDSDIAEERAEAEKAEKEARERAEAERQEKLRAEQEKAAEELKRAKETARKAEAERAAAERARREAEETAGRLAEEARRARLEAAAAKRHAARTPEAEKAILSAWNRRGILRAAVARHAARTAEMAAKIQKEWDGRRAKIREAVKTAAEIRKEYSGIKGLPFPSTVKKAENGAKYTKAAELARKFKAKVESEAARLDLLDNPLDAMKKHGLKETRAAYEAVKNKLESFAGLSPDARIKKLEFEIKWVGDKKKYATWEVARDAYAKALAAAKFEKAAAEASARILSLEAAAKAAKDKTLTGYVNKLKKAGTPTTQAELDALEREIAKAEKRAAKANKVSNRQAEILREANERHANRSAIDLEKIQTRWDRRKAYKELINKAETENVNYLKVFNLQQPLTEKEIVQRLAGGDLTKGSCSSLALAYAANKAGLDVLDFRDGESRILFSKKMNVRSIVENGGFEAFRYSEYNAALDALDHVESGKEYYFVAGCHAAIVRKSKKGELQYLELQSGVSNGFKPLNEKKLIKRFDASPKFSLAGGRYSGLIDLETLTDSPNFKRLMGYINTDKTKQRKGKSGTIK